jgi:hypothetical protein
MMPKDGFYYLNDNLQEFTRFQIFLSSKQYLMRFFGIK